MIGIVIIAHGTLGETLIECATHVLSARPARLVSLTVTSRKEPDTMLAQARRLVRNVDAGDGVLLLTDMLGGTPSNIATRLIVPGRIEGVAGVSLPMLVRALNYRAQSLRAVVGKAFTGGHDGVIELQGESILHGGNRG